MSKLLFAALLMSATYASAADLNQAYQEGKEIANSHAGQAIDVLKTLDVSQFPGFEANLPQQNYYGGVTQQATTLEADAMQQNGTNDASQAIIKSFNTRPYFEINSESEGMARLHAISDDADAIIHNGAPEKVQCSLNPERCEYRWREETCETNQRLAGDFTCTRALNLDLTVYKTESYILFLDPLSSGDMVVNLGVPNTCLPGVRPCYSIYKNWQISEPLRLPANCRGVQVNVVDGTGLVHLIENASCEQPIIRLKVEHCITCPIFMPSMTVVVYQGSESWDDGCASLKQKEVAGICKLKEPAVCLEPNGTRVISGIPQTRACWKEQLSYRCGGKAESNCDALIAKGCEQSASQCLKIDQNSCISYQQTYLCPETHCTSNQLLCGEDSFCLDGNCSSDESAPDNQVDFNKALSALSAVSEGAKGFNGTDNFLFKGQRMECSKDFADAKDCCRDSGWGIDMNLFHCSDAEKKLGAAKESNLVVPTGEYCANRQDLPGGSICLSWHNTYCVFQSKLARIVQEQGRRNQLGIGFGEGEYSNCSGITPEQLQLIQFEGIDFSEFYADIKSRMKEPDYQKTADGISQRVNEFYNKGATHG